MSDKQQIKEDATRKIIVSTAQWIAALLGPDMNGAECIHAIHQFAKGVEDCEPVYPPASPTKRVRAAAYVTPSGYWAVLGYPSHDKTLSNDDEGVVKRLLAFYPPEEHNTRVCMVDIDLPLPMHNSTEVIQAASVEEVAE